MKPEFPVVDEMDGSSEEMHEESNLNHKDEMLHEADLQKIQKRRLTEKVIKPCKGNDEVEFKTKHSSDVLKTSSSFYVNRLSYFACVLIMLIGLLGTLFYFSKIQKPVVELSLSEKLKNMKDTFQDQNYLTFRILEMALKKVVNATVEPSAPAIFTVVVNKNAVYKSHEFLHYLAKNLAPQSTVLINE